MDVPYELILFFAISCKREKCENKWHANISGFTVLVSLGGDYGTRETRAMWSYVLFSMFRSSTLRLNSISPYFYKNSSIQTHQNEI
jgi:hypothetical protein